MTEAVKVKELWYCQLVGANVPHNQMILGRLLKAKSCTVFNFTERYDVNADDMLLCCTGYVIETESKASGSRNVQPESITPSR
jgi:hypothetical protein